MKVQTIAEVARQLANIKDEQDPFLIQILQDERKGVQQIIQKWRKQIAEEQRLKEKFLEMNTYETKWRSNGFELIAGVDEVGRGPLAGPVAAAAVILPADFFLAGIDDSKKLSEKKRLEYDAIIRREALAFSVSMIDANEIDEINIYEAAKKAMKAAIASLQPKPDFLLIDAMKLEIPYASESIIKGDAKSISIAAASIIAKVARDKLMKEISLEYPRYHFQQNMGYGTKEHLNAIQQYGITPYHRKSFAPIKDIIKI
ncbi:ribonuclease HII [Neobacillus vireti]|uniref:Ribonuclease HII n=1 Tax=Neobacillus vireti LMG 21834 TaxID=1131730 RepID=A0AB94IIS3_9BACI|nr:ribonuclease HII [Neobacillus vireti]ETI66951.1 ribonuclease HII [Neobacillus vireti LMG 21834]KLT19522.1 ribonuclease H [Neobacillus vireti]